MKKYQATIKLYINGSDTPEYESQSALFDTRERAVDAWDDIDINYLDNCKQARLFGIVEYNDDKQK